MPKTDKSICRIFRQAGFTETQIAENLGISYPTLYRRLCSPGEFTVKEVNQLIKLLGLTMQEARELFFED